MRLLKLNQTYRSCIRCCWLQHTDSKITCKLCTDVESTLLNFNVDSTQVTYRNNLAHHFETICKNIPLVMIKIACTVIVNNVIRSTLFCAVFNWQEWNETLTEISTFNFWLKYLIHSAYRMLQTFCWNESYMTYPDTRHPLIRWFDQLTSKMNIYWYFDLFP